MAIKLKDFILDNEVVALVNFPGSFQKLKSNSNVFYVLDFPSRQNMKVINYFKKNVPSYSSKKFLDACKMVLLDAQVLDYNLRDLSRTEIKKLRFVEALLSQSKTLVFENFERGFYGKDRAYYQKLLLKLTKYGKSIVFVTNDISFLFGFVKRFVLFTDSGHEWIDDFYNERVYRYVYQPKIISYVNYLNQKNISMDHYIEPKEVLKAIYRDVNSRGSL